MKTRAFILLFFLFVAGCTVQFELPPQPVITNLPDGGKVDVLPDSITAMYSGRPRFYWEQIIKSDSTYSFAVTNGKKDGHWVRGDSMRWHTSGPFVTVMGDTLKTIVDSTRLTQDSILVYYQNGTIVRRDTISGTGGGGGGGADNWGSQVVVSDGTLTGDGTSGNALKVDTSIIATQSDIPVTVYTGDGTLPAANRTITLNSDFDFSIVDNTFGSGFYIDKNNLIIAVYDPSETAEFQLDISEAASASDAYFRGANNAKIGVHNTNGAYISTGSLSLLSGATNTTAEIKTGSHDFVITDNSTDGDKGLEYAADYSASYKDRTLPDVAWVRGEISDSAQVIDTFSLSGTTLNLSLESDGEAAKTVDLSSLTTNETITLSGDVTGSGTTAITTTIAAGAVGADELESTAVTPGSYTHASITVDADGRVTAASSGTDNTGMTTFDVIGDAGTAETVQDGDELYLRGQFGVNTSNSATDIINFNVDSSEVSTVYAVRDSLARRFRNVYQVEDYGAHVDTTDNSPKIQSAIDAAAANGGGIVKLTTPGVYLVESAGSSCYTNYACIIMKDSIDFVLGAGVTLKLADDQWNDTGTVRVSVISVCDASDFSISGGKIDGNAAGQTTWTAGYEQAKAFGVQAYRCHSFEVRDMTIFNGLSNPINFHSCYEGEVVNMYSTGCGEGPEWQRCHNFAVRGYIHNDSTDVSVGDGFELSGCRRFTISGVQITENGLGAALDFYGSTDISLNGFMVQNWNGVGISLNNPAEFRPLNISVSDGVIRGNRTQNGIQPNGNPGGSSTINNVVFDSLQFGLYMTGSSAGYTIADGCVFKSNLVGVRMECNDTLNLKSSLFLDNTYGVQFDTHPTYTQPVLSASDCDFMENGAAFYYSGDGSTAFAPKFYMDGIRLLNNTNEISYSAIAPNDTTTWLYGDYIVANQMKYGGYGRGDYNFSDHAFFITIDSGGYRQEMPIDSVANYLTISGDNLGNHTATTNLQLNGNYLSNDGGSEGLRVDNSGKVAIGGATFEGALNVIGSVGDDGTGMTVFGATSFGSNSTGTYSFASGQNNYRIQTDGDYNFGNGADNFYSLPTNGDYNFANGLYNYYSATTASSNFGNGFSNGYTATTINGNFLSGLNNFYTGTLLEYNFGAGSGNFQSATGTMQYNFANGLENFQATQGIANFGSGLRNFEALGASSNYNVGIGYENFMVATSGSSNIGIGLQNFKALTGASAVNIGLGESNLNAITSGNYNTAIGWQIGVTASDLSASNVVAIGNRALFGASAAAELDYQIAIGFNAGRSTTVDNAVHIGRSSKALRDNEISLGSSSYTYGRWDITGQTRLPTGTTAQRGGSPETGDIRYNTTLGGVEYYDGAAWTGTPQYAQSHIAGGENTSITAGTAEQVNATTTGTVTTIVNTSEFTVQADGDLQYTGANNSVLELNVDISVSNGGASSMYYYIAINGTVQATSRVRNDAPDAAAYTFSINWIDSDADTNDVYSVYAEPVTGTELTTVTDMRIKARKIK